MCCCCENTVQQLHLSLPHQNFIILVPIFVSQLQQCRNERNVYVPIAGGNSQRFREKVLCYRRIGRNSYQPADHFLNDRTEKCRNQRERSRSTEDNQIDNHRNTIVQTHHNMYNVVCTPAYGPCPPATHIQDTRTMRKKKIANIQLFPMTVNRIWTFEQNSMKAEASATTATMVHSNFHTNRNVYKNTPCITCNAASLTRIQHSLTPNNFLSKNTSYSQMHCFITANHIVTAHRIFFFHSILLLFPKNQRMKNSNTLERRPTDTAVSILCTPHSPKTNTPVNVQPLPPSATSPPPAN